MATKKSAALVRAEKQVVAVQQLTRSDLATSEAVESLVSTAVRINDEAKAFADQKSAIVKKAKALYAPEIDDQRKVTLYGFESGAKLTISYSGGGVEVDDGGVYASICEYMGCDPDNPTVSAIELWESITVPQPRVLDKEKLAKVMVENPEVRAFIDSNSEVKNPTVRATISKMTKTEKVARENGDLNDNVVIG